MVLCILLLNLLLFITDLSFDFHACDFLGYLLFQCCYLLLNCISYFLKCVLFCNELFECLRMALPIWILDFLSINHYYSLIVDKSINTPENFELLENHVFTSEINSHVKEKGILAIHHIFVMLRNQSDYKIQKDNKKEDLSSPPIKINLKDNEVCKRTFLCTWSFK